LGVKAAAHLRGEDVLGPEVHARHHPTFIEQIAIGEHGDVHLPPLFPAEAKLLELVHVATGFLPAELQLLPHGP